MADTTFIKNQVEPYIRGWLGYKYVGRSFAARQLRLQTGGLHEFDAVSEDGALVGNILSNRAKTRTGKENTGGVRKAQTDIQFLNLLPPEVTRFLVFTDEEFSRLIGKRGQRMGSATIDFLVCVLPDTLKKELDRVLDGASREQRAAGER